MTIHSEHPFEPPTDARDPLRRLRGRLPQPVTVWTTRSGRAREGWTLGSVLLADGDPGEVLGLLDADSELADALEPGSLLTLNLLAEGQQQVAEAFARLVPSPGGPFRTGSWTDGPHGPRLQGAAGWIGARVLPGEPDRAGWFLLVRAQVQQAEVAEGVEPLVHHRGRYRVL